MKTRPTIFISGVSHEFGSFRDAVENEVEKKGCFAENQPNFHADHTTVEEIAERGPMRLFLADIHLYRARLFFREQPYPWKSPQDDLAAAEQLINACGYHRRDEELADAKQAILGQALS